MKFVPAKISRAVGRKVLTVKKNSPHILFISGVVGVGVSTVMACRATLKLEEVVDNIREDVDGVKHSGEALLNKGDSNYSDKDHARELGIVYGKSAIRMGKLYGPAVVVGTASIAALTGSHVQLTRRNTALTATIVTISKAYEDYRDRVRGVLGVDQELDIYRGVETEIVTKNGSKEIRKVVDPNKLSPYAVIFDESSPNWRKEPEYNRIFLTCQQNYANDILRARGHVFLNEIYDAIGVERTSAGQVVGWVMNGDGDNYVDFGLFEASNSRFINNEEPSIILDFNVDGVVYDKF